MLHRAAVPFFVITLLSGCATPASDVISQTESYAPTSHVEILLKPPMRPHKTFALLEDTLGGTPAAINARLAITARRIGADAVVITAVRDKRTTDWVPSDPNYNTPRHLARIVYRPMPRIYREVRANAIRYTDRPSPQE